MAQAASSLGVRHYAALLMALSLCCGACAKPADAPVAAQSPAKAEPATAEASSTNAPPIADSDASAEAAVEPAATATVVPSERFLLLTSRGPLIVQLQITLDGAHQRAAAEKLLDEAEKAAAGDSDGVPTWMSLVTKPEFIDGRWGNESLEAEGDRPRVIERYDSSRDGRVQRGELAKFLSQDNFSGWPFSVQSLSEQAADRRQEVSLFALLDRDQNGRLSPEEMIAAAELLRTRDANDDGVVTLSDFRAAVGMAGAGRGGREGGHKQAIELSKLEGDSIYYTLSELYGSGGGLNANSFALTPGLFAEVDTNKDGMVFQRELAAILDARADLAMKVNFAAPASLDQQPTLELERLGDDLAAAGAKVDSSSGRLTIRLPGFELAVVAVDATQPAQRERGVYGVLQVQVRAGQSEDLLFAWLDVNHDGRLTPRELEGAARRLAELDRDAAGFVTLDQLPEQVSCAILRGAATMTGMPTSPAGGNAKESGELPRWLKAMDLDGDGEVSSREFLGTAEQFTELDRNGDGFVDAGEVRPAAAPSP